MKGEKIKVNSQGFEINGRCFKTLEELAAYVEGLKFFK